MDLGISGKRVLITGASRGIGGATAKAFAAEGASVLGIARKDEQLKNLIEELGGESKGHGWITANLREQGEPARAAKILLNRYNKIDIVIHNVGSALGVKNLFAPVNDWQRVWQFNVGVAIEMNAILIPPMQVQQWGRVIHISSISGAIGEPMSEPFGGSIPYAAAKAYLNMYVKGLGRELAKDNIVVSALLPAALRSEGKYWDKMCKQNPEIADQFLDRHHAIKRFGTAEEIAPFAVFMASEQASFANAALIPIDGGRL
jgi:3-oxoacyl-[acyl-carrier protein] reductase